MKKAKEVKKSSKKFRFKHNRKLFWTIIVLLVVLILLIYYIRDLEENTVEKECAVDEDCISKECCHPETCGMADQAELCDGVFCTAVCSGPLDCGAGRCGCVKGKCEVVPNK